MKSLKKKMTIIFLASSLTLAGCTPINRFFGVEDDNFAEEFSEDVFRSQPGVNRDFSPKTPESPKY